MDSDSESTSSLENEAPIAKRKVIERINFNLDNFSETFRVSRPTAERIIQEIGFELEHDTAMN